MAFNLGTNPNITVVGKSTLNSPGTEDFILFYDSDNSHHLTGAKNIGGTFSFYDYEVPFTGGITYKGTIDASANPNFPAAIVGDMYIVSVAGTICGIPVNVGDMIISTAIQASGCVPADWTIIEANAVNWQLDGNPVVAEKFIGTTTAFDFPIRTNNVERARYFTAGQYAFGSNVLLATEDYSIKGLSYFYRGSTTLSTVAGFYQGGTLFSQYNTTATGGLPVLGGATLLQFDALAGNSTIEYHAHVGTVYYDQSNGRTFNNANAQTPSMQGLSGVAYINSSSATIDMIAGNYSVYGNFLAGATVTKAVGYFAAGMDATVASLGTTSNYYAFFALEQATKVGAPAATNRWGFYIDDICNNYIAGYLSFGNTTADTSSVIDVVSTTRGILIPRMTTAQRNLIAAPANSLLVYNSTTLKYEYYDTASVGWFTLVRGVVQTYTPTNVTTDRSYDADATTIDELADVLGTLIGDLQTAGIIL